MEKESNFENKETLRNLLENINKAWTEGHPNDLKNFFDEDIVIAQPGGQVQGRGKQECVDSYKNFLSKAEVKTFDISEPLIELWQNTAVVSYKFKMAFTLGGNDYHDSGVDLFVFSLVNGCWLAVWRSVLPS